MTTAHLRSTSTKRDLVRRVFEQPQKYLSRRRFDIQIRSETVQAFVSGKTPGRILDIGCGDGSLSLPFLDRKTTLTLLDFSSSMLEIAKSKIPPELAHNVRTLNQDVMTAVLEPKSFDLIICVGILAHVESPDALIVKIVTLLKPGGAVILEFTDAMHWMGRVVSALAQPRKLLAPPRSPVNLLSFPQVVTLLKTNGLRINSAYRYALLPIPGLNQDKRYNLVRRIYGTPGRNRNSRAGNEYICLLTNVQCVSSTIPGETAVTSV